VVASKNILKKELKKKKIQFISLKRSSTKNLINIDEGVSFINVIGLK